MSLIGRVLDKWTQRAFIPGQGMTEPVFMWSVNTDEDRKAADYLRLSNAVYVCNRLRAQNLSGLPIRLYRQRNGNRDEITQGDLFELLQRVNPFWTWQRLIEMTEMSLGVWGDAYWFLDRGQSANSHRGRVPREIWWARSDKVRPIKSATDYISHFELIPDDGQQPIRFERDEVIWFRYPNPANEWEGLAPLAAAAMAADAGRSAAMSNSNLFRSGIQMAGIIAPAGGSNMSFTDEQANLIEQAVNRRFRDPKNAHKWAVLRQQIEFKPLSVTPKDAEFLGTLSWSLEEVCRAYGVPIDLVGGQRTYENYNAAQLDLWYRTLLPEARFIANELTEQLLPLFPGQADIVEFDVSDVPVLQEAERAKWTIDKEQITAGVKLQNEWREEQGLDPVAWGDVWWAPIALTPVSSPHDMTLPGGGVVVSDDDEEIPASNDEPRMLAAGRTRSMGYDSPEHRAYMQRAERRQQPGTARIGKTTADLMKRQRQSILAQLRQRSITRDVADMIEQPFNLARWIREFSIGIRPVLHDVMGEAGAQSMDDLGVGINFDLFDPNVINALEKQVQRFAREVNETTWDRLKDSLGAGYEAGETVDQLAERVNAVMGDRIASSGETIARTESNITHSNADILSWKQSGVVGGKEWLAALDDRTRESHVSAHGQIVGLDEPFNVGGHRMQGPGLGGPASEVVNCRCHPGDTLIYANDAQAVMRRWYDGPLATLTLSDGRIVSATPNHPMLTRRGWVAVGDLDLSDDLIGYRISEDTILGDPNPDQRPTTFEEVFGLHLATGRYQRMRGGVPDFHGDGADGQIDVIWTDRELRDSVNPSVGKPSGEHAFAQSDVREGRLSGNDASFSGSVGEAHALISVGAAHADNHRVASVAGRDVRFEQPAANDGARNTERFSNRLLGIPGNVSSNDGGTIDCGVAPVATPSLERLPGRSTNDPGIVKPLIDHNISDPHGCRDSLAGLTREVAAHDLGIVNSGTTAGHGFPLANVAGGLDRNTSGPQSLDNRANIALQRLRNGVGRLPGYVTIDKVVRIEVEPFSGHVYNLQTERGFYLANGFVSHNCAMTAVLDMDMPGWEG